MDSHLSSNPDAFHEAFVLVASRWEKAARHDKKINALMFSGEVELLSYKRIAAEGTVPADDPEERGKAISGGLFYPFRGQD